MNILRKNDKAWNELCAHYNIVERIAECGQFVISAEQIKQVSHQEPRLITKFDHSINLPKIFADNHLSILPVTRGSYVISEFKAYHTFEERNCPIQDFSLPEYLQSINDDDIPSETIAINAAYASGILSDFFEDESLCPTVCGRMRSGNFDFEIKNVNNERVRVGVQNSQIEIDSAYEGLRYLSIIEAKKNLSDDFLIRQLYYPYRTWSGRINKRIKPIFLVHSNGIFHLYQYDFEDPFLYNSLKLVKYSRYSIENTVICMNDVMNVLNRSVLLEEPEIAFPQADKFERVINLCEILSKRRYTREEVTENYAFDVRQTNYYTDAAQYLGLARKIDGPSYELTSAGKSILAMPYKRRQLAFCEKILQHKVFNETLKRSLAVGCLIDKDLIVSIMRTSNLYKIESDSTFGRRASTVRSWVNWILNLVQG